MNFHVKNHSWISRIAAVEEGETVAVGKGGGGEDIFTVPMNFVQILWHDKNLFFYQPWGPNC